MRFALLGNHPDGLEMACALIESGRHQLVSYSAPVPAEYQPRLGPSARLVADLEELLADPAIEMAIVAGNSANRATQLRRALQSERHVLSVYPPDPTPDLAYETSMIRDDTHMLLFPLLPDALHPGVRELALLLKKPDGPIGRISLVQFEVHGQGPVLLTGDVPHKPGLPGWDVLRFVGGEIAEVSALSPEEGLSADQEVVVHGRFESGTLFQSSFVPHRPRNHRRLTVMGDRGSAELFFPYGERATSYLACWDQAGHGSEIAWQGWDPWSALVTAFESTLEQKAIKARGVPSWQDVIRALELDDAVRRSAEKRRASLMEYPEATESAGFKGTMTLVGCGMLWLLLVVVIVATQIPKLFWLTIPILAVFLGLQLFRWIIPRSGLDDRSAKKDNDA